MAVIDDEMLKYLEFSKLEFSNLRNASESDVFPYHSVTYIMIEKDGRVTFKLPSRSRRADDLLINMFDYAEEEGAVLIAPWVGEWRTDIFRIDDFNKARESVK